MADITSSGISVDWCPIIDNALLAKHLTQSVEELVKRGSVPDSDVIDLISRTLSGGGGGEEIGLHCIIDKTEVPAGFAVAIDEDVFPGNHRSNPFWDNRSVGAGRILALAEDVEVA